MRNRSSVTIKILSHVAVMNNINALIKRLYSALFTWIVQKINHSHASLHQTAARRIAAGCKSAGFADVPPH